MSDTHRQLTSSEIEIMARSGCKCKDWSQVLVSKNFDPATVAQTTFGGKVRLGTFRKKISFVAGFEGQSGIYHSTIHNCNIGNNVYINNVHTLANYNIDDECIIANIAYLATQGRSAFGNGVEVEVLNEAGGREVPIYDKLSAQIAYMLAIYRHRPKLIKALKNMISSYVESVSSDMGNIGKGTKIMNCGTLKNVRIGPNAILEGVSRMENGSINSTENGFVRIGANVIAHHFIISSDAKILDNVILHKCFVGQATELAKGYSAEESAFFANCGGFHGEACSVFAGPFTVTHHKATLLIAGMFSFFNAGSASNQSNHMYKLGSVHEGVLERGSKMGSGSYLMFPAKVGPFNVVMGRHYCHPDTTDLPFSYIVQSGEKSLIVPAVNLRSVGTVRDTKKWPKRDNRKAEEKLDLINFNAYSPFTVQRMIKGISLLESLKEIAGSNPESIPLANCEVKPAWVERGIDLYNTALDYYLGNVILRQIEDNGINSLFTENPEIDISCEKWADMAGLMAPAEAVESLLQQIETGKIEKLQKLNSALNEIFTNYSKYELRFTQKTIKDIYGKQLDQKLTKEILEKALQAKEKLTEKILEDAKKEFAPESQTGFGIDGDEKVRKLDFESVRGNFETNPVTIELREDLTKFRQRVQRILKD